MSELDNSGRSARPSVVSLLVLAAIGFSPAMFGTAFSSFESLKWAVGGSLVAIAGLIWAFRFIRGASVSVAAGRIAMSAFAFALFAALGVSWTEVPMYGTVRAVTWLTLAGAFLFIVAPAGRPIRFPEFALALAMGTGLCGIFGLLEFFGVGIFTPVWDPAGPTGAFDSAELATAYYAVSVPVLIAGSVRHGGTLRVGFGIAAALGALHFGMLAPAHVMWIVAIAVVSVSLIIVVLQSFSRAVLLYPAFGAFLSAVVVAGAGSFLDTGLATSDANRLPRVAPEARKSVDSVREPRIRKSDFAIGRTESFENMNATSYVAGVAFDVFRNNPVFGGGTGSWWISQTNFPREEDSYAKGKFEQYPAFKSPHNGYLLVAAELGAVGFLLFMIWIASVLSITATALASREEPENWAIEHWGLVSGAVAGLSLAFVTSNLESLGSGLVLFGVLAMLTRQSVVLNGMKGMSTVWDLSGESRRIDHVVVAGVVPALLAAAMVFPIVSVTLSRYHQGLADHLMLRDRVTQAEEQYLEAHRYFPYDGEVVYNLLLIQRRKSNLSESREMLDLAVELRPHDARLHYLMALHHLGEKSENEAIKSARAAVTYFPNYVDGYKTLALAFDMKRRYQEAADTLRTALALGPPEQMRAPLHQELGQYYEAVLQKPKLALEHLRKAAALSDDPAMKQRLGFKVEELEKQLERERLLREGKPVPSSLMPGKPGGHDHGHGHGGHGHGGHGHGGHAPGPGVGLPMGGEGLPVPSGSEDEAGEDAGSHDGHEHP